MTTTDDWRSELATRRAAVWSIVENAGADACLVFGSQGHAEPFRYLTNFTPVLGDTWAIVRGADSIACVLNFDWQLKEARERSGIETWYGQFDAVPRVIELLAAPPPRRVAVVGLKRLPAVAYEAITKALPQTTFVDIESEVAQLRRRKSPLEIRMLREAGRITDAALEAARDEIRPGITEYELMAKIGYVLHSMGAEWAFPPCVVSGVENPIPIREATSRRLQEGDSVMIDIGASYHGYQADASRTYVLGTPNQEQRRVWDTILRAYDAALELARPGIPCNAMHQAAVQVIEEAGYRLVHRIGHGIGLATSFEWPSLDTETSPLVPGMTFCIEPGIYIPGAGNMKLEDDVVITEDGYELLTSSNRELVVPL